MIKEINTPLVTPVMRWLVRRVLIQGAIQRAFHAVRLRAGDDLARLGAQADPPVILMFSNHCTWWDAYLWDIFNTRMLRVEPIVMAEQRTVRNYGFFRHLGLFSVDRLNPRAAVEAIRHAVKRAITTTRAGVFIFPQGEFRPFEQRPLGFFGGAGRIAADIMAAKGACVLLPLAIRLEFLGNQKPEAWLRCGAPISITPDHPVAADAKGLNALMETALTREIDGLAADLLARDAARYPVLLRGTPDIQEWWDGVRRSAARIFGARSTGG
ncbi:MAG TPA: lysophospholipid acyltransferase family protein [Thermoflexales bacterium]|nr:lysophospholipid acyltransferase family protein [Anaerolineae bacterium]HQV27219.1 lysophospholipid acyltransferase family protein [Thermoflexales bacterium]HQX11624.1 lysophospholipid acyltransferase family protein [Thermoflexales bacterium]HQY24017.1 lysophospholipid acyltransferase family protein [Thermoflexales bacterium]HQZ52763.1 lysophospholipid acyltransferase family protein [Thermoflexales bacterium]